MSLIFNPQNTHFDCFAVASKNIIVAVNGKPLTLADLQTLQAANADSAILFEEADFQICTLSLLPSANIPAQYEAIPMRSFFSQNTEDVVLKVSRAQALAEWQRNMHFCNRCGSPLVLHRQLTAMQCESCQKVIFPRIEPCVIVLVKRDDQILLARHVQRNQQVYACIAGFMEAGETAEQAVRREVHEETGLTLKNIRYFGSQSWPFPSQLMLAFTAEYASGNIELQATEISDARWFSRSQMPQYPPAGSVAHAMITAWLNHEC